MQCSDERCSCLLIPLLTQLMSSPAQVMKRLKRQAQKKHAGGVEGDADEAMEEGEGGDSDETREGETEGG